MCFHNETSSFQISNDVSKFIVIFPTSQRYFLVEFDVYESIICDINMTGLIWLGLRPVWQFFRIVSYCEITIRSLSKTIFCNTRTEIRKRRSGIICTDHKKEQIAIIAVSESAVSGSFLKLFDGLLLLFILFLKVVIWKIDRFNLELTLDCPFLILF